MLAVWTGSIPRQTPCWLRRLWSRGSQALWTNIPLEAVPDMIQIDPGPVESHVLFDTHNVSLTEADVARVRGELAGAA